jgi:hypothetical protein
VSNAKDGLKRVVGMDRVNNLMSIDVGEECKGPNCDLTVTASAEGTQQIVVPDATRPTFNTVVYVYPSPDQIQIGISTKGVCAENNTITLEARTQE